ncbi:hypothetical protein CAPTEDRAFT_204216 [Capitella teleta]|uniref:NACHT domain-containing protein n=1 Tax=Capitella teleta TaxID=283909 RepID=R7VAH4_CAPTE|nr:hypothetical protein CAPTEDRAFT_204216 [Capitella teleta]|eukprot:ELU12675.1 hypothetical protein CAPTEDRAFT_204216 [Capitella teleta]
MPWVQRVRLSLNDVYVDRNLKVTTTHKSEETQISTDQLFEPIKEGQKIPRRLLIEGNPGNGKSTICDWLAYKWSQLSNGETRGICSFDLVIYLHAKHLKDQTTIADAIKSHLLPEDFDISSCRLTEVLKAKYVLFIVDGFDEACSENPLLEQLIERNILRHTNILLTSRRGFLQEKLKYFDLIFEVEDYDEQQQLKHIERFAEHQKLPMSQFKSLLEVNEVENLCKNPLHLTLLCLLHIETDVRTRTQTELYSEIHGFILRKVIERMKLTEEDIEHRLLRPLYQLAFEAFENGEDVLHERDFERAGLLSEEATSKTATMSSLVADAILQGPLQNLLRVCVSFVDQSILCTRQA